MDNWEFNVLGVYNYRAPGKLDPYFSFIAENHHRIPGDIVEAGVFRGRSFLATALLLRDLGSRKKVYGYDSFSGFPPVYHPNDNLAMFDVLRSDRRIAEEQYENVAKLKAYQRFLKESEPDVKTISTSGDFSATSLEVLRKKIEFLGLGEWTVICSGPFDRTMTENAAPRQVMAATLDCDLYESYRVALKFIWPRMPVGGYIWLDEYYSLKFPGARIACDEFFEDKADKPQMHVRLPNEFERWFVRRNSA